MRVYTAVLVQYKLPENGNVLGGCHGEVNIEVLLGPFGHKISHLKPLYPHSVNKLQIQVLGGITEMFPNQLVSVLIKNFYQKLDKPIPHATTPAFSWQVP